MIAMTIFMVIMLVGMGAVLNAVAQHELSKNMRTVMDNMNFIMEDMSRNIRLGTNFHCVLSDTEGSISGVPTPQDCPHGSHQITFLGVSGSNITYTFDQSSGVVEITKQVGSGTPQIFTLSEVDIDYAKSGFVVDGSLPPPDDTNQPVVNIGLSGTVQYKGIDSKFSIRHAKIQPTHSHTQSIFDPFSK